MAKLAKFAGFVAASGMWTAACGTPLTEVETSNVDRQATDDRSGGTVQNQTPVNQRFRNLDEYLAHLERTNAPIDKPWYREIRPGVYELQTGNLRVLGADKAAGPDKRIFTREELERKFGFRS